MPLCYLVGAGDCTECFVPKEGDLVIAVDGGVRHLRRMGVRPHLAIGDFDSAAAPTEEGVSVLRYPAVKDDTDMALALREGARRGYREFLAFGALGGPRLAHTLANLALLADAAAAGLSLTLVGGGGRARVLRGGEEMRFSPHMRGYLSVFAFAGAATGVTLRGLRYSLQGATLTPAVPLGVSNEFLPGEVAEVSCRTGELLLLWQEPWRDSDHDEKKKEKTT